MPKCIKPFTSPICEPINYKTMFLKPKINFLGFAAGVALVTAMVTLPFTSLAGKKFNSTQDFSCCMGNKLVVHHFYTQQILGIALSKGYDLEVVQVAQPQQCPIVCSE